MTEFTIDTRTPFTADGGRVVIEASMAGLRPGRWPLAVRFGADVYFRRDMFRNILTGDVTHVVYVERTGRSTLTVLND